MLLTLEEVMDQQTQRFNERYITGPEICQLIGVSPTTVRYRVQTKFLPKPINLGVNLLLWERTPELMTLLDSWKVTKRKG